MKQDELATVFPSLSEHEIELLACNVEQVGLYEAIRVKAAQMNMGPGARAIAAARLADALRAEARAENFVYFIQAGLDGPVKIGMAANVLARVAGLQTGNAEELRLLGFIRGGRRLAEGLHRRFRPLHIRGGWFRPASDLLTEIARILARGA